MPYFLESLIYFAKNTLNQLISLNKRGHDSVFIYLMYSVPIKH